MNDRVQLKEDITIIYPPTVDWFLLYQRPHQLLTYFSKHGIRSIFISSEAYKRMDKPIIRVNNDLFIVSSKVDYKFLTKGKKILWFSYPPHYTYAKNKFFDYVVFDALDNPADEFANWKHGLEKAEEIADLISCTAQVMYDYHSKAGKPVFICQNGADYEHFKKAQLKLPKPGDFPKLAPNEKVVGFYGAMASWVDYDIITKIAEKYKVVLVGNNRYYSCNINHPNIINLPHKPYHDLPFYLSNFDVTLIPFKLTEMIKGCDPIKFYEYLSAGKPVVATEMDELKKYKNVTYFMNIDNCQEMVAKALEEDNIVKKAERIKVAKENSWDSRVQTAIEMINLHLL